MILSGGHWEQKMGKFWKTKLNVKLCDKKKFGWNKLCHYSFMTNATRYKQFCNVSKFTSEISWHFGLTNQNQIMVVGLLEAIFIKTISQRIKNNSKVASNFSQQKRQSWINLRFYIGVFSQEHQLMWIWKASNLAESSSITDLNATNRLRKVLLKWLKLFWFNKENFNSEFLYQLKCHKAWNTLCIAVLFMSSKLYLFKAVFC